MADSIDVKDAAGSTVTVATNDLLATRAGGLTETAPASDTASSGLNGRLQRIAQRITSLLALFASGTGAYVNLITGQVGVSAGSGAIAANTPRVALATDSPGVTSLGQATMANSLPMALASNQSWPAGMSPRVFSAAFTTLTRPANTTPYGAGESISDNATAGSVTALSATLSDVNDDPITLCDILINSTDTGLAGKKLRANLFNSNPTSNSGVGAGDNAAYSQKKAGYIGTFVGTLESGFSDGTVGRLVPSFRDTNYTPAGGFVIATPVSGAKTLYIQFVAEEAFTPSANSTTIIATARGYQGRAA